ncbi:hypothetical protein FKP32DRAFT_1753696 [Trametes sanguinea]|nr:hypothetical protein FKP32DRAFT_1753696 [Trametes sanguinea]
MPSRSTLFRAAMYHVSPLKVPVLSVATVDAVDLENALVLVFLVILVSFTTYYVISKHVQTHRTSVSPSSQYLNASIKKAGLLDEQASEPTRIGCEKLTPPVAPSIPISLVASGILTLKAETHGDADSSSPPMLLPATAAQTPDAEEVNIKSESAAQECATAAHCEEMLSAAPSTITLYLEDVAPDPVNQPKARSDEDLRTDSLAGTSSGRQSTTGLREDSPERLGSIMQSALLVEADGSYDDSHPGSNMSSDAVWTHVEDVCTGGAENPLDILPTDQETVEVLGLRPSNSLLPSHSFEASAILLTTSERHASPSPFGSARLTAAAIMPEKDLHEEDTGDLEEVDIPPTSKSALELEHGASSGDLKSLAPLVPVENSKDVYVGPLAKDAPRIRKHTPDNPDWAVAPEEPPSRQRTQKPGLRTKRSKAGGKAEEGKRSYKVAQRSARKTTKGGCQSGNGERNQQEMGTRTLEGVA